MPLFNDEQHVSAALDSCLAQTLHDIEVVCVDDASSDATVAIVERYAAADPRVRLVRQPSNRSAFQARRAGIAAARAPYVLFLDGDDELAPSAALASLTKAESTGADIVGFGVEIVVDGGNVPKRFEAALQPVYEELRSPEIVPRLLPAGEEANGHLWRYLFATDLLRQAYAGLAEDLTFYRANDLPIAFLALARARRYVSLPDRLYRYYFRRGTSGHLIDSIAQFRFILSGVEPITAIEDSVVAAAHATTDPESIMDSYRSARLHIIGNILRYCLRDTSGELRGDCLTLLKAAVGEHDVVRAAAGFVDGALEALSRHRSTPPALRAGARRVLLTTAHLSVGGLQNVLIEQARMLVESGYIVTVAVSRHVEPRAALPDGVELVEIAGTTLVDRLDRWRDVCRERDIEVIIDHHILYNTNWPWFVLAASSVGIPTIGWIHNFALRPVFDGTDRSDFLNTHLPLLHTAVTLSPTDVAFWKLRGIERVCYLPNPLSKLALAALAADIPRDPPEGVIELVWWGRFDPPTKQVLHLVEVAAELRARGTEFRLTIIGADSSDLTAERIAESAHSLGVADAVRLTGGLMPEELISAVERAHVVVMTSAIEGSPLAIVEAQALGLPVVMYDLPWLTSLRDNRGIITTAPNDRAAIADAVRALAEDPGEYVERSRAAREYASQAMAVDLRALTASLLSGSLPQEFSPEPTLEDARLLVEWLLRFSSRNARGGAHAYRRANELRRDRDRAQKQLRDITAGPSFRLGRAITLLPRAIRRALRDGGNGRAPWSAVPMLRARRTPPPAVSASADGAGHRRSSAPDVSFIVPSYNSAPWLADSVTSALAQTAVEVEVICIDDGSTDGSIGVLRRLAEEDDRVTVVDQPNRGQSVARNRGIDLARGRYAVFLDSDDYWTGDGLASLVRRADSDRLDVLLFDCICIREGEVDDETWDWYSSYYQRSRAYEEVRDGAGLIAAMRRNGDYRPHVGLYLTRMEYLRESGVRFVPGIVHQDNPYTFRLLLNAARAAHEPIAPYVRRIRPGSTITTLDADRSARGYVVSYLEMKRELDAHDLPGEQLGEISEVLAAVYDSARRQVELATDATVEGLRAIDSDPDSREVIDALLDDAAR